MGSAFWQIRKKPSKKIPKTCKLLPKLRNFDKSGHTALLPQLLGLFLGVYIQQWSTTWDANMQPIKALFCFCKIFVVDIEKTTNMISIRLKFSYDLDRVVGMYFNANPTIKIINTHTEIEWSKCIWINSNILWVNSKLGHFKRRQKYCYLQNSQPQSADVKYTQNKNHLDFIYSMDWSMLSLY